MLAKLQSRFFKTTLVLAASFGFISAQPSTATKLNATPLPRERQEKDFSAGQVNSMQPTRWQRRPDYRDLEAQKKIAQEDAARKAEEARLKAIEDARKAQGEQLENYKKRQQTAVEANNKAVAFGKQGRWNEAIEAHEMAVQYDPQNKQFRINLSAARTAAGQQRMTANDLMGAAALFRKALSAAGDNGLAGRLLAEVMKRQGRDPLSADVRLATGDQLAAIGDYEGASVEYQAALQIEGSARSYVKMGDVALRYGQIATATNWYRQAIVKDHEHGPAHRQLGLLAVGQRDYTGAAASLRKAVILDPKDTAAGQTLVEIWRRQVAANPLLAENHLGLAGSLQLTGDFAGAESEYRKLEALDPKNPGLQSGRASLARAIQHARAEKHRLAAETLFNQGLRREALSEISQAVMMEPRNAKFQFLLGECLEANGDFQGAHQAYLTCVLMDPENNKEAAARMREMQNNLKGRGANSQFSAENQLNQLASQLANQFSRQAPANQIQSGAPQSADFGLTAKNQFEGAPVAAPMPAQNLAFRSHDELDPPPAAANNQAASNLNQTAVNANAAPNVIASASHQGALNDGLAHVTDLESHKDYVGAITMLRQLLGKDLQNAAVHHRLAVNLLASGQITEAISEFRIASALSPSKKAYTDDLARALAIHKRSLASTSGTQITGDNGVNVGAIK